MTILFVLASLVAIFATILVVTRTNIIHALLYLVVSFLAVALIFYLLGAPFVAALEVIIYAGAIMVLFVFAVMVLNPAYEKNSAPPAWAQPNAWLGPLTLTGILGIELVYTIWRYGGNSVEVSTVGPHTVGLALYGPYLLGVEMVSMLLLAGLVGAYHLGRPKAEKETEER